MASKDMAPWPLPRGGVVDGTSFDDLAEGTTLLALNARPNDWRDGGRDGLAQRPGWGNTFDQVLCTTPIRAVLGVGSTSETITLSALLFEDNFDAAASTSSGSLGDRDGNGTDDYALYAGSPTALTGPPSGGASWAQSQKFSPSDTDTSQSAGSAVAASESYLAIGVPNGGRSAPSNGYVDVWDLTSGTPAYMGKLTPSDPVGDDDFGAAVDVSGDYIVVGAPNRDDGAKSQVGKVYVFELLSGIWTEVASFLPSGTTASGDNFGSAVAIDGDRIAIGERGDDTTATNAGRLTILERTAGTWALKSTHQAPSPAASETFGYSVDIDGDYIVVGARNTTVSGSAGAGRAYVYFRSGGSWAHQATIPATVSGGTPDHEASAHFGESVSISGDTIAVGAPDDNQGATDAGAVYVYTRSGTSWSDQQKLSASDGAASDHFGEAVSLLGDRLLIGAPDANAGGTDRGKAYIFDRVSTTWSQTTISGAIVYMTAIDVANSDHFGISVSLASDKAYVGSRDHDQPLSGSGAAYQWSFTPASSTGPFIEVTAGEGRVVDDQVSASGTPVVYAAMLVDPAVPTTLNPYNVFVMQLRFKTAATITGAQGGVGFFCYANKTSLDASTADESSLFFLGRLGSTDVIYRACTVNGTGSMADQSQYETALEWEADSEYTIELRVSGTKGEVWLTGPDLVTRLLQTIPNIRKSGSTEKGTTNKALGFMFACAGDGALGEFLLWVDDFRVYSAVNRADAPEGDAIVSVCAHGDVMLDDALATNGASALVDRPDLVMIEAPRGADGSNGLVYMFDGRNYKTLDPRTGVVEALVASDGDLPAGQVDTGQKGTLACFALRRLVISGLAEFPANVYFSKEDDPTNWQVTPPTIDGSEAVTFPVDQPVTSLSPFTEDIAFIGANTRSWFHVGNPSVIGGGQLVVVSTSMGPVGPHAICQSPYNDLFMVTRKGFFRMPPGSREFEPLSTGRYQRFFDNIDHSTNIVRLAWEPQSRAVMIVVQPRDRGSCQILYWHARTGGFWPDTVHESIGPTCVGTFADATGLERLIAGGWDGHVRTHSPDALADDSEEGQQAIGFRVQLPPMVLGIDSTVGMRSLECVMRATSTRCEYSVAAATHVEAIQSAAAKLTGSWAGGGRMKAELRRVSGNVLGLIVASGGLGQYASIEQIAVQPTMLGDVRRRT